MKSLQLVCINYGSFNDALSAVIHCIQIFPKFNKATILHPDPIVVGDMILPFEGILPIQVVQAKSLTQNECCLYEMPQYITCDHALGIQWDGFIVRPDLWDDRFLDYDLIAPPWPLQNIVNKDHRVGSGGFVLFSKRMCQLWGKLCDPHPVFNDWNMGAVKRELFEAHGMKYAPLELAAKFGKEHDLEDMDLPEGESFGFHSFRINSEYRERYRKMVYG